MIINTKIYKWTFDFWDTKTNEFAAQSLRYSFINHPVDSSLLSKVA